MATPEAISALRDYLGAGGASSFDDDFLGQCWDEANALVSEYVRGASTEAPQVILDRATKEVASELFHRQAAPNGITQFADGQGNPVRVARNPMVAAYPILAPWAGMGIG